MKRISLGVAFFAIVALIGLIYTYQQRQSHPDLYMVFLWLSVLFGYLLLAVGLRRGGLTAALFPISILAVIEIAYWTVTLLPSGSERSESSAATGGVAQATVNQPYFDAFDGVRFFSDGIRAIVLPANIRSPHLVTNSLGFRGDEFSARRPDTVRIALLGGSAAFGWQAVSEDATVYKLLEHRLRDLTGRPVEVLNLAIPAGNSLIDYAMMGTYVRMLAPQMVVFLTGNNDINGSVQNIENVSIFASDYLTQGQSTGYKLRILKQLLASLGQRLVYKVYTLRSIAKWIAPRSAGNGLEWFGEVVHRSDDYYAKYVKIYQDDMASIFDIAHLMGCDVVVFHQPIQGATLAAIERKRALHGADKEFLEGERAAKSYWKFNVENLGEIYRPIESAAARYGYAVFDLSTLFEDHQGPVRQGDFVDDRSLFISSTHWTASASRIIANAMAEKIAPRLAKRLNHDVPR